MGLPEAGSAEEEERGRTAAHPVEVGSKVQCLEGARERREATKGSSTPSSGCSLRRKRKEVSLLVSPRGGPRHLPRVDTKWGGGVLASAYRASDKGWHDLAGLDGLWKRQAADSPMRNTTGYLLTAGQDKLIHAWPLPEPTKLATAEQSAAAIPSPSPSHTLIGHEANVCALNVSSDGKRIVSGSWDKYVVPACCSSSICTRQSSPAMPY